MKNNHSRSGLALPIVLCAMLVVGIISGGLLLYVSSSTRLSGNYSVAMRGRLAAQSALDQEVAEIYRDYCQYLDSLPTAWNSFAWFQQNSEHSLGVFGFESELMQDLEMNGCQVTVTLIAVACSSLSVPRPNARVTLQATATATTVAGVTLSKTIEEGVEFALTRSEVFDYAYFVNNFGWFMGGGVTANGNIRANGNLSLDGYSWVNGNGYACANTELGALGLIYGTARSKTLQEYWAQNILRARPTDPTSQDGTVWQMGYNGNSLLSPNQQPLRMPFLGDLDAYRSISIEMGATIKQQGTTLVNGCYSGVGPSGLADGEDRGCLVLDGTSKPIVIDGPVVVDGDVIIKGTVKGQGVIYAGRNIYIVGDLKYDTPPTWEKPDTKPEKTVDKNLKADMLGLAAKGNIVLGNYTSEFWMPAVNQYITPPFVKPYACDPSDAGIGYAGTFDGDYSAKDGGKKVQYVYDRNVKRWLPSATSDRRYYESTAGNRVIEQRAQSSAITRIDAVLYNNHAVMGRIGACSFNGALVCRDEGIIYNSSVTFNWDIRLGSSSRDGMDFFIYLPMSPARPRVIGWQEVSLL